MENNIFEKLTAEEQDHLWMYMIFNADKIKEKTEQWIKEAEKAGMTLTEYLESINPLNKSKKETKMEDIQMKINEQIRLIHEDEDKFIFETIRTYTDGVLAHEGIFKIPKKLLERALICFKLEHPAEFELLLNGDEGMKQRIVEDRSDFHCGFEESGGHTYNCNDCPNKCDEWYQWDKEMKK